MSVLATGLPSLNLEAHYQTFFTGVIVIGAVLLDMYRNRKASEVRIETPADSYKASMVEKISDLKRELASRRLPGTARGRRRSRRRSAAARTELKSHLLQDEGGGEGGAVRIRAEERAADHEFAEMLKRKERFAEEETELLAKAPADVCRAPR